MELLDPVLVHDLFPLERRALLQLLRELDEQAWHTPTVCAGWSVKDIAQHLLADDLGILSRKRDSFDSTVLRPSIGTPSRRLHNLGMRPSAIAVGGLAVSIRPFMENGPREGVPL